MTRRGWMGGAAAAAGAAGALLSPGPALALASARRVESAGAMDFMPSRIARLDRNENPYGPSEKARQAVLDAVAGGNRYSDEGTVLEAEIARREGLTPEHVVLGNGSHALLCMAGLAYGLGGGEILGADLTYEGLLAYADVIGARVVRVPLAEGLVHDLPAFERRVSPATRLVFVCNPNNPTGTRVATSDLRGFCESVEKRTAVFVDEAYLDYVDPAENASMVPLVREGRNVIVSRTFSKLHGLAGLRIGYALARPDVAERLRKLRPGGGGVAVNALGLRAALASLGDADFVTSTRRRNAAERATTAAFLAARGIEVPSSHGNFLYFTPPVEAGAFAKAMESRGVRVGARAGRPGCRLTIGTADDMKAFRTALDALRREKA